MNKWKLPTSLNLGGVDFEIRTNFTVIIGILNAFSNPEYTQAEAWEICLRALYVEEVPEAYIEDAMYKALEFINAGIESENKPSGRLMDWDKDAPIIAAEVSKIAGYDIRNGKPMHWWTFIGYYMEIGEGLFNTIVSIRSKRLKGKKLEQWEKDFIKDNAELLRIDSRTDEDRRKDEEDRRAMAELLGE